MMSDEHKKRRRRLSPWAEAGRRLWAGRRSRASLLVVALFAAVALYGEIVYRYHRHTDTTPAWQRANMEDAYRPPSLQRSEATGSRYLLGTDGLGRDVLRRLIQGARVAFLVGIVTSLMAIPIGLALGGLAGYYGGRLDDFVVWLYSTFASIPGLLFILAIAMVVGKGLLGVCLGIGLTTWVGLCRLIRAEVIRHKGLPYVTAARVMGLSSRAILCRHILPNVFHLVIVTFTLRFPAAIGTEVFLSFLGLGVQGEPSWGTMIQSARMRLWQGAWWELTFVTLAIFAVVLAFNLLGDALRDALDPRLREQTVRA